MTLAGRSERTIRCYVDWVRRLAEFYRKSPDQLRNEQLVEFLLDLHKRKLAFSTINQAINAFRYFYGQVLDRTTGHLKKYLPRPGSPRRAPRAYSPEQIERLLDAARDLPLHYTFLSCLYHTGLRLNEGCYLRFNEIERGNQRIFVSSGKGNKDRYTILPQRLMEDFDRYFWEYRKHRPLDTRWMFVGKKRPTEALSDGSAQHMFYRNRKRAGLPEVGGIHVLRHSFASHQLLAGMDLERLRHALGHKNLATTLRYLHLVKDAQCDRYDPQVSPLESLQSSSQAKL